MIVTKELNQRRRAIYYALLDYFPPTSAEAASQMWLDEFSHRPIFELQPFISKIYDVFDTKVSRKDIQQSIIKLLVNDGDQIPENDLIDTQSSQSLKDKELQTSHIVFSDLLTSWLVQVDNINHQAFIGVKNYILNNVSNFEVDIEEMFNIKRWLSQQEKVILMNNMSLNDLKKMFHIVYVGSCEFIGPTQTDKIISEIVEQLSQTKEGKMFSPKSFF